MGRKNKLKELLSKIESNHICIQTHIFPDPDAIACAFAMQELLNKYGITSDVCYGGLIDKYSTKKLVEYLDICMKNVDEIEDKRTYDTILFVDSQAGNSNSSPLIGKVMLCIDHHEGFEMAEYAYADICPDIGACATIILQYYLDNDVPISCKAATALSFGLQIDTYNLTRGTTQMDVDAFQKMYQYSDHEFLNMIYRQNVDQEGLIAFTHSFNNLDIKDKICFVNVGDQCPDAMAATISDFVLDIEDIQLVLAYTKRENGVKFSMRSISRQFDCGILMYAVLLNIGSGGGHPTMAGGFISKTEGMDVDATIQIIKEKLVYLVERICSD